MPRHKILLEKRKLMRITSKLTVLLNMSKTASPILTASLPRNSASDASKPVTNTFFARTALDESGDKGEFKRVDASWRNWVKKGMFTFLRNEKLTKLAHQ
jgi:hypothetical protein